MKMCQALKITIGIIIVALLWNPAQAQRDQKSEEEAAVKKMIETQSYVFKAQIALPMGGSSRPLTSTYDMKVSDELITAYLPYFGRAYRAPSDMTGGGIRFESKDFEYTVKDRKKGGWDILIQPDNVEDVRELSLTISENGSASLRVSSDRRQPISFNGYITEGKP